MKVNIYDSTGKKTKVQEINPKDFGTKVNENLVSQALRVYEYNSHQRTSKAKTRGEITGSTKKIYRQKGTGRARHGDNYAPIFVGGGVAHGPLGLRGKNLVLPKKMKRKALSSALLTRLLSDSVSIVSSFDKFPDSTKKASSLLSKITGYPKNKVLVIVDKKSDPLYKSTRNLQNVTLRRSLLVNTFDIISHDHVLISPESLDNLKLRVSGGISKVTEKKVTKAPTKKVTKKETK